jgi:hypothetical protein
MKDEWWAKVEQIFHDARELDVVDRSLFLEKTCGSDVAMRRELDILLSCDTGRNSASLQVRGLNESLSFRMNLGSATTPKANTSSDIDSSRR